MLGLGCVALHPLRSGPIANLDLFQRLIVLLAELLPLLIVQSPHHQVRPQVLPVSFEPTSVSVDLVLATNVHSSFPLDILGRTAELGVPFVVKLLSFKGPFGGPFRTVLCRSHAAFPFSLGQPHAVTSADILSVPWIFFEACTPSFQDLKLLLSCRDFLLQLPLTILVGSSFAQLDFGSVNLSRFHRLQVGKERADKRLG